MKKTAKSSQRAAQRILAADPVMAALIEAAGPCRIDPGALRNPFESLVHAIAHQQLNGTAAGRILARFTALFDGVIFPSPQQLLEADAQQLRAAGFSFAKIAALKDLAAKTLAGVVPAALELANLEDLEIIERLTAVRGIGRWTVEMMLIFQLQRPDVLPVDDFGVRNGFRLAYRLRGMPLPRALATFGERWKPYRSMAAWYLWRAVDLARADRLPRCARPPRIAVRAQPVRAATRPHVTRHPGTAKTRSPSQ
ncbi:MAG: DNA-3-methyladenine glycosylase family protein [Steroidobacteraceae bacterium]